MNLCLSVRRIVHENKKYRERILEKIVLRPCDYLIICPCPDINSGRA